MDDKQRRVLVVHRNFLTKNVLWSDQLEAKLVEAGLITDSTLRDIQLAGDSVEKMGLLLEGIVFRQVMKAYEKFCDIIQACGHAFIADFLRDAEHNPEKFDPKEIYQKLHFLGKLRDTEKKELENYFIDKFRDETLKMVWKDDVRDKEKAVEAKRMLIEMHADHKDETKKWQGTKEELEKKLQEKHEEIIILQATIRGLKDTMYELQEKQRNTLDAQLKYTQANESQFMRMKDRLGVTEEILTEIQSKICTAIKSRPRRATNPKEELILEQNKFAFAMEDLNRLLEKHEDLKEIGFKYVDLCKQRDYILTHMGHDPNKPDAINLLDAYKDFVVKSEETLTEMRGKLETYGELVETHKKQMEDNEKKKNAFQMGANVWQSAIMNVMRNQLQDTKKELRIKESRLQMTEQENKKMKATMRELENEVNKMKRSKSQPKRSKETLSVELLPGNVSVRSDQSSMEDLSDREDNRRTKALMLPPLPNPDFSPHPSSPRKASIKNRQLGLVSNRYYEPALPDGLTTAPVKLETRHRHHVPGLGDLKAMNSRSKFEKSLKIHN